MGSNQRVKTISKKQIGSLDMIVQSSEYFNSISILTHTSKSIGSLDSIYLIIKLSDFILI